MPHLRQGSLWEIFHRVRRRGIRYSTNQGPPNTRVRRPGGRQPQYLGGKGGHAAAAESTGLRTRSGGHVSRRRLAPVPVGRHSGKFASGAKKLAPPYDWPRDSLAADCNGEGCSTPTILIGRTHSIWPAEPGRTANVSDSRNIQDLAVGCINHGEST